MNTAAKWFKNDPLLLIADGNHDTIILKRHETDLMERLHALLREGGNAVVHRGGFSGWVRFMFSYRSERKSLKLAYHHGYGGDAPVTKGTIQTNRMAVYLPDADFVCTGHTHNEWQFPIARLRLSDSGRVYHDEQLHLELPSYKDEYREGEVAGRLNVVGHPSPLVRCGYGCSLKGITAGSELAARLPGRVASQVGSPYFSGRCYAEQGRCHRAPAVEQTAPQRAGGAGKSP